MLLCRSHGPGRARYVSPTAGNPAKPSGTGGSAQPGSRLVRRSSRTCVPLPLTRLAGVATWEDGPEYAPLERPQYFADAPLPPLEQAPPAARPADGLPTACARRFDQPSAPVAPLATLVPTPPDERDPARPFEVVTATLTSESGWGGARRPAVRGHGPLRGLGRRGRPARAAGPARPVQPGPPSPAGPLGPLAPTSAAARGPAAGPVRLPRPRDAGLVRAAAHDVRRAGPARAASTPSGSSRPPPRACASVLAVGGLISVLSPVMLIVAVLLSTRVTVAQRAVRTAFRIAAGGRGLLRRGGAVPERVRGRAVVELRRELVPADLLGHARRAAPRGLAGPHPAAARAGPAAALVEPLGLSRVAAPARPRTLTESLRRWPVDAVEDLLRARPDLTVPMPRDLSELASRATTSASTSRALDDLDAWQRLVAEALAALPDPTTLADLDALLGGEPRRDPDGGRDAARAGAGLGRRRRAAPRPDRARGVRAPPARPRRAVAPAPRRRGGRRGAGRLHPGHARGAGPAPLDPHRRRPAGGARGDREHARAGRRPAGRAAAALARRRHRGAAPRGRPAAARGPGHPRAGAPPGPVARPAAPGRRPSSTAPPPAPPSGCSTTSTSSPAPSRTRRSGRCAPAAWPRGT